MPASLLVCCKSLERVAAVVVVVAAAVAAATSSRATLKFAGTLWECSLIRPHPEDQRGVSVEKKENILSTS